MTRKDAEAATSWVRERDERLAHIARLQGEYRAFELTCTHWTTRQSSELGPSGSTEGIYVKCEWCGKEWEP